MSEKNIKSKEDVDPEKEKEEIEKQTRLLKQIQENDELLKFTLDERKKLLSQKNKEIEKKEKLIQQMEETNQNLQSELEILQVQIQGKLNKEEINKKNEQLQKEKKTRLDPLISLLESEKNNLKEILTEINNYKIQIKKLRDKIDERVDLEELNSLTDEIKISSMKNEHLIEEIQYLEKVQNEHIKCGIIQNKLEKEIKDLENLISNQKKNNRKNAMMISKEGSNIIQMKIEGKSKEQVDEEIQKSLNEFWDDNKEKLVECQDLNDDTIEKFNNNKINNNKKKNISNEEINKINKEIQRNKNLKAQRNLVERIRNDKIKSKDELPKICLFNSQEKKILLNVLPEKEIEEYEKRFECIDNAKNNLQRKFNLETKELEKQTVDLRKRFEYSKLQIKQNEQTNKLLLSENNVQKREIIELKNKVLNCIKKLEEQKKNLQDKEDENKAISKRLQEIQMKYEKAPPQQNNDEEEEEENENEEREDNEKEEDDE